MKDKTIFTPLLLVVLGIAFLSVSLLITLFAGNKKLIASKFKLGGIILSLTATASSCHPFVTCYEPAINDDIAINDSFYLDSGYVFNLTKDSILTGTIYGRTSDQFSFRLDNQYGRTVQRNDLFPADGNFDNYSENFYTYLNDTLNAGDYTIYFYNMDKRSQEANEDEYLNQYALKIKQ